MRIKKLSALHKKVIHSNSLPNEQELDLEELWVQKYPYDVLHAVCEDCFASPDRDLTQDDMVEIQAT